VMLLATTCVAPQTVNRKLGPEEYFLDLLRKRYIYVPREND